MMNPHDSIRHLLAPSSVAIVGASQKPGPGSQAIRNLDALGFSGRILPINPNYDQVHGYPCYPSLSDAVACDGAIDAVAILLGRDRVVPVLEEAAELGIRAGWAFASGFGESDSRGRELQKALQSLCAEYGIAFCGPNCVGISNPGTSSALFSAPLPHDFPPGSIAFVSQSGSIGLTLINGARDMGLRTVVSSGNEAVLDSTDYLRYFLNDPETRVVAAFIEEFRRPEQFVRVAELAQEVGKPLIILKVGRSDIARRATVAHTGALAGADDVYDAVFRKYGVIRVHDLNELVQTAIAFAVLSGAYPAGARVGMLTLSGGAISLSADLAEASGLLFPDWSERTAAALRRVLPDYAEIANPLDAWGSGRLEETYKACVDAVVADAVDMVVFAQDAPSGLSDAQREQFSVVARTAAEVSLRTRKPMVAFSHLSGGLNPELRQQFAEGRIPLLQGTREGLLAIRHLARYGEERLASRRERAFIDRSDLFDGTRTGVLDEIEGKALLSRAGIPCVEEYRCDSVEAAIAQANTMGYPVVLKGATSSVAHKSDHGLVRLGLRSADDVRNGAQELLDVMQQLSVRSPSLVVQRMVEGVQVELLVGMARDAAFGPFVIVGLGGTRVEIVRERAIGLPPLNRPDVHRMLSSLAEGRLLSESRGLGVDERHALEDVVLCISDLALSCPESLVAIEMNPLLVLSGGRGVVAVDALIEFAKRC